MYCINCGEKLEDDSRYCPKCGVAVHSDIKNMFQKTNEPTKKANPKPKSIFSVGSIMNELLPVFPQFIIILGWFSIIAFLLPKCTMPDNRKYYYSYYNDNSSMEYELLLILIFFVGSIVVPFALKNNYVFLKLEMIVGLLFSTGLIIFLIGKESNSKNKISYGLLFIVELICIIIVGIRILLYTLKNKGKHIPLNASSLAVVSVSVLAWLILFAVSSI